MKLLGLKWLVKDTPGTTLDWIGLELELGGLIGI